MGKALQPAALSLVDSPLDRCRGEDTLGTAMAKVLPMTTVASTRCKSAAAVFQKSNLLMLHSANSGKAAYNVCLPLVICTL